MTKLEAVSGRNLHHNIDIQRGDIFRPLGRYNGSLGKPENLNAISTACRKKFIYSFTPVGA